MLFRSLAGALMSAGCVFLATAQDTLVNTAPYDPSQFSIIGTITDMTLGPGGGRLTGGSMSVDGIPIVVPENTIVTLPATAVAWPELFKSDGTPDMPGYPAVQWKATVFGNRVTDRYIAGLIYIAQDPGRILQGFVTSIDNTNGHFTVAGSFGDPAGVIECVISDPLGIYGPVYTNNPMWSVDPVNPSIHASTGFPMCIPRDANDDPLCPKKNRPTDAATGKPTTQMTFPDPANSDADPTLPDARIMAPIVVGDYITFTGQSVTSEAGTPLFEVNGMDVNCGFYTAPGTKPAYITVEEVNFGIRFPVLPDPPETRAVAFTTDPTTTVQWYAMDVDPCTGTVKERNLLLLIPQAGAPIGRCVFRFGTQDVSPATRNVGFRMSNGVVNTTNGLIAGQYVQPVMNFIFPEISTFGAQLPPLAFDHMPFIASGSGPYTPGNVLTPPLTDDPVPIIGQLNPWPGDVAPQAPACAPVGPSSTPPTGTATDTATATATTASDTATASATAVPAADNITIVSAVSTKSRNGSFTVAVIATSDNPDAVLQLGVSGANPVPSSPMTKNDDGSFSLTVLMKGKPTSVTVTSQLGGIAVATV